MDKAKNNVYAILLAGGTGTRLWPVSRQLYPKQLVKFIGEDSLAIGVDDGVCASLHLRFI